MIKHAIYVQIKTTILCVCGVNVVVSVGINRKNVYFFLSPSLSLCLYILNAQSKVMVVDRE